MVFDFVYRDCCRDTVSAIGVVTLCGVFDCGLEVCMSWICLRTLIKKNDK